MSPKEVGCGDHSPDLKTFAVHYFIWLYAIALVYGFTPGMNTSFSTLKTVLAEIYNNFITKIIIYFISFKKLQI